MIELKELKKNISLLKTYVIAALAAVILALFIRVFIIEAYRIPTSVMEPTLLAGDIIFATKGSYGVRLPGSITPIIEGRPPKYSEVVIYSPMSNPNIYHIRRVIGLAGDSIELKEGVVYLNQKPLKYAASGNCGQEWHQENAYSVCMDKNSSFPLTQVPEGHVLVLSDQRRNLSKLGELVPFSSLRARALFVWLSISPEKGFMWNRMFSFIK